MRGNHLPHSSGDHVIAAGASKEGLGTCTERQRERLWLTVTSHLTCLVVDVPYLQSPVVTPRHLQEEGAEV